jgi:O-acetylhomoserine (thiol)-lyase
VQWLRDFGACLSPFNAFLFLQGPRPCRARIAAHCANAAKVASWLSTHPEVSWVNYPGLQRPRTGRAPSATSAGARAPSPDSGSVAGSTPRACFIDSVRLFSHLANIGDARAW